MTTANGAAPTWNVAWRAQALGALDRPWDLLVIGGGITGAGIAREAARAGLQVLLVEQRDFAWGTSSRSSKMVHGGLRYLREGHLALTRAALLERERLIREAPGLVEPLGFLIASYAGAKPGPLLYQIGLLLYDLLAVRRTHRRLSAEEFRARVPDIRAQGLLGGFRYGDAHTDDARLVLRVLREAAAAGAVILNHVRAEEPLRDGTRVVGMTLRDALGGVPVTVRARAVVNATGAWADRLRASAARIRPLRGSHLIFRSSRVPLKEAVTSVHPDDGRAVFMIPWEGVTVVGTTDLDHRAPLDDEPSISAGEVDYLLRLVGHQFPHLGLGRHDVLSTYSGVRPVIGTGQKDPSKESRDHAVWDEDGLITVTGGKLTTFRLIARDALRAVARRLPDLRLPSAASPILDPPDGVGLSAIADAGVRARLLGRFGREAAAVAAVPAEEQDVIPGTPTVWAELRWAARAEAVAHLDDLLLRRVRVGLLLPDGAAEILPRVRAICAAELGWDDARWEREEADYRALVRARHGVPAASAPA